MIDLKARNEFAELLHQFVAGQVENFEFENSIPNSKDPAIYEIWWRAAWPLYDDFQSHKLKKEWRIPKEHRKELAKAILFLKTNNEYLWPRKTGLSSIFSISMNLLTFGRYNKYQLRKQNNLETQAWPFATLAELSEANNQPPYLDGINT